ncbi:unnamed protein product, partial [Mesorhabditis spiculigera]
MLKGRPKEALFGCLEAHASSTFLTSLKDSVLQKKAIKMLESKAPLESGTERAELLAAHWHLYQALPWHEVAQLDEKERGERQALSTPEQWFLTGEKLVEALAADASISRPSAVVRYDKEAGRAADARAAITGNKRCCPLCIHNGFDKNTPKNVLEHTTLHARINLFGCHCCMQAFQSQEALEKHECKAYQTFRKKGELALVAVKMFMICSSCGDYTAYTKQDNFKTFMMNHPMEELVSVAVWFESREFSGKAVNVRHVPTYCTEVQSSCDSCKIDKFDTVQDAEDHFRREAHPQVPGQMCPKCERNFYLPAVFHRHLIECHSIPRQAMAMSDWTSSAARVEKPAIFTDLPTIQQGTRGEAEVEKELKSLAYRAESSASTESAVAKKKPNAKPLEATEGAENTTAENWATKWKGNAQLAEIMGKLGLENPADFVIFTDLVEQSKDHNPTKEPCAIVSDPPGRSEKSPMAQDIINRFAVNLELRFDRQSIKQADIDHRKVFFCLKITCQAFVLDERKMREHLKGCDSEADIDDPSKAFPVRPRSRDFHARHYCHKCKFSGCSLDSLRHHFLIAHHISTTDVVIGVAEPATVELTADQKFGRLMGFPVKAANLGRKLLHLRLSDSERQLDGSLKRPALTEEQTDPTRTLIKKEVTDDDDSDIEPVPLSRFGPGAPKRPGGSLSGVEKPPAKKMMTTTSSACPRDVTNLTQSPSAPKKLLSSAGPSSSNRSTPSPFKLLPRPPATQPLPVSLSTPVQNQPLRGSPTLAAPSNGPVAAQNTPDVRNATKTQPAQPTATLTAAQQLALQAKAPRPANPVPQPSSIRQQTPHQPPALPNTIRKSSQASSGSQQPSTSATPIMGLEKMTNQLVAGAAPQPILQCASESLVTANRTPSPVAGPSTSRRSEPEPASRSDTIVLSDEDDEVICLSDSPPESPPATSPPQLDTKPLTPKQQPPGTFSHDDGQAITIADSPLPIREVRQEPTVTKEEPVPTSSVPDDSDDEVMEIVPEEPRARVPIMDEDGTIVGYEDPTAPPTAGTNANRRRITCPHCQSSTFISKTGLDHHVKTAHSLSFGLPLIRGKAFYVCLHCRRAYENQMKLISHDLLLHVEHPHLTCPSCSVFPLNSSTQATHVKSHFLDAHDPGFTHYTCFDHELIFGDEKDVLLHQAIDHGIDLLFVCKKCRLAGLDGVTMYRHVLNCKVSLKGGTRFYTSTVQFLAAYPANAFEFYPDDVPTWQKILAKNNEDGTSRDSFKVTQRPDLCNLSFTYEKSRIMCSEPDCGNLHFFLDEAYTNARGRFVKALVLAAEQKMATLHKPPQVLHPDRQLTKMDKKLDDLLRTMSSAAIGSQSNGSFIDALHDAFRPGRRVSNPPPSAPTSRPPSATAEAVNHGPVKLQQQRAIANAPPVRDTPKITLSSNGERDNGDQEPGKKLSLPPILEQALGIVHPFCLVCSVRKPSVSELQELPLDTHTCQRAEALFLQAIQFCAIVEPVVLTHFESLFRLRVDFLRRHDRPMHLCPRDFGLMTKQPTDELLRRTGNLALTCLVCQKVNLGRVFILPGEYALNCRKRLIPLFTAEANVGAVEMADRILRSPTGAYCHWHSSVKRRLSSSSQGTEGQQGQQQPDNQDADDEDIEIIETPPPNVPSTSQAPVPQQQKQVDPRRDVQVEQVPTTTTPVATTSQQVQPRMRAGVDSISLHQRQRQMTDLMVQQQQLVTRQPGQMPIMGQQQQAAQGGQLPIMGQQQQQQQQQPAQGAQPPAIRMAPQQQQRQMGLMNVQHGQHTRPHPAMMVGMSPATPFVLPQQMAFQFQQRNGAPPVAQPPMMSPAACMALFQQQQQLQRRVYDRCGTCNHSSYSPLESRVHNMRHADDRTSRNFAFCLICQKEIHGQREKDVVMHMVNAHQLTFRFELMCPAPRCPNPPVNSFFELRNHLKMHVGVLPHRSEHCPLSFRLENLKVQHEQAHARVGTEANCCMICGSCRTWSERLPDDRTINHDVVHAFKRWVQCRSCGYTCQSNDQCEELLMHWNQHHSPSPLHCQVCDERFPSPGAKRDHVWKEHRILLVDMQQSGQPGVIRSINRMPITLGFKSPSPDKPDLISTATGHDGP